MNNNYDEYIKESNVEYEAIHFKTCWECLTCVFKVITRLIFRSGIYNNLYQVFKYRTHLLSK